MIIPSSLVIRKINAFLIYEIKALCLQGYYIHDRIKYQIEKEIKIC